MSKFWTFFTWLALCTQLNSDNIWPTISNLMELNINHLVNSCIQERKDIATLVLSDDALSKISIEELLLLINSEEDKKYYNQYIINYLDYLNPELTKKCQISVMNLIANNWQNKLFK